MSYWRLLPIFYFPFPLSFSSCLLRQHNGREAFQLTGLFGRYFSFGSYPERLSTIPFSLPDRKQVSRLSACYQGKCMIVPSEKCSGPWHNTGDEKRRNMHLVRLQLPKKELVGKPEITPIKSRSLPQKANQFQQVNSWPQVSVYAIVCILHHSLVAFMLIDLHFQGLMIWTLP